MQRTLLSLVVMTLLCWPHGSRADDEPWRLGIALGYGERSNPLAFSDDIPLVVDIDIAWFGDRWFFDNGDLGFMLRENGRHTLNLVARISSDRLFFSRTNTRFFVVDASNLVTVSENPTELGANAQPVSVPDRDYALEAGIEVLTDGPWGELQLAAHHDISGVHHGFEVYANYARGWRFNRWHLEPSAGFTFNSGKRSDYYWGVRAHESSVVFPRYTADAGTDVHARVLVSYRIDRHWSAVAVAQHVRLGNSITASPIVVDEAVSSYYAGFHFGF